MGVLTRAMHESHDCGSAVCVRINVRFLAESPLVHPSSKMKKYHF
jgi:hypothetical protein